MEMVKEKGKREKRRPQDRNQHAIKTSREDVEVAVAVAMTMTHGMDGSWISDRMIRWMDGWLPLFQAL